MDIISPLLQWLNANPQWAGFVTFLISAAESVAIIGTIVPGSITMTAIGTLAGAGIIPLWGTIIWAIFGAILGDGISYWLGFYFKDNLRRIWPFRSNPGILDRGEVFVNKYGWMSVFIGRFVGPVRALVPLVAGMLGLRPFLFLVANVTSAIFWAPAYMLPGILLGAASLELPPDIAMHVMIVLFLMFLFVLLCIWIVYKLFQSINKQTENLLINFWNALEKSRYFRGATVILKHHNRNELHGQLTLAFYFLLMLFLFSCLTIYVKAVGAPHIFVNDAVYHLGRGLRNPVFDTAMLYITLLGQKEIIIPTIVLVAVWLMLHRCFRASIHVFLLIFVTAIGVFIVKNIAHSLRPWGIFASPETFSMPSGHTTLATALYIGTALIISSALPPKRRKYYYLTAIFIAILVGISRIYLGAHWFTDVLAGWLFGIAVVMLIVLSFNRQPERPIPVASSILVGFLSCIIVYSYYSYTHLDELRKNYAQIDWPKQEIKLQDWWQNTASHYNLRVSLFGFPSERINLEWAGNFTDIKQTLMNAGWSMPPARDWVSSLHRLADVKSSEYLPMVAPQFLDKKPALILAKRINGKKLLVLRLWESNFTLRETQQPLWVGTIGLVPRSYSWLLFRRNRDMNINSAMVLPSNQNHSWQWKLVVWPGIKKNNSVHRVLLIK